MKFKRPKPILFAGPRDPAKQNYTPKVIAAAAGTDLRPGTIYHVTIAHDDDCPIFRGGDCRCNPDVSMGAGGEQ